MKQNIPAKAKATDADKPIMKEQHSASWVQANQKRQYFVLVQLPDSSRRKLRFLQDTTVRDFLVQAIHHMLQPEMQSTPNLTNPSNPSLHNTPSNSKNSLPTAQDILSRYFISKHLKSSGKSKSEEITELDKTLVQLGIKGTDEDLLEISMRDSNAKESEGTDGEATAGIEVIIKVVTKDPKHKYYNATVTIRLGENAKVHQIRSAVLEALDLNDGDEYYMYLDGNVLRDDAVLADEIWLQNENALLNYNNGEKITVVLQARRRTMTQRMHPLKIILNESEEQIQMEIDYNISVSELLGDVCRFFGLEPSQCELLSNTKKALIAEKSLAEQGVPMNSEIHLKSKQAAPKVEIPDIVKSPVPNSEVDSTDKGIWEEGPDNEKNIRLTVDPKSKMVVVQAATLNKLIERLTTEKDHNHIATMKVFIFTYQSFTTPGQFMAKLIQRYHVPKGLAPEQKKEIQLRVCNVLKNWIDLGFSDFNDSLLPKLNEFINSIDKENPNLGKKLRDALAKGIATEKAEAKKKYYFTNSAPAPKIPRNLHSVNLNFLDVDDEEIARQLTLLEFHFFSQIKPSELLNQSWNKKDLQYRSPHVLAMIERFNTVSAWVATMIIKVESVKVRAKMMAKCINIMKYLRQLNNFSTLMSFIAGFNNAAVSRLQATKSQLSNKQMEELASLEKLMSGEKSFKTYRHNLHHANPPLIPYMGMYLSDLTFIEDGNPDQIDNLINFEKRSLVFNALQEIMTYQQVPYNIRVIPKITSLLKKLPTKTDKELWELSLVREPRK